MTGTIRVGWNHHLTPKYQSRLFNVAYLQALRMAVDCLAETGKVEMSENQHDQCTRLAMARFFKWRASCACTGCAERKREILSTARRDAARTAQAIRDKVT